MLKLVVLCALFALTAAKPWNPAYLSPRLLTNVPVLLQPRYIPTYPGIVPVVEETPVLLTSSPYVRAIKKRSLGVLENATLGAAAAAVKTFTGAIISANGASAQAANPSPQQQVQTVYPQQQVQTVYPQHQIQPTQGQQVIVVRQNAQ